MKLAKRFVVAQSNEDYVTTVVTAEERKAVSLNHSKLLGKSKLEDHSLFSKCNYPASKCDCGHDKRMTGFICEQLICQGDERYQALSTNSQDFVSRT
jgi:hypothetical protein